MIVIAEPNDPIKSIPNLYHITGWTELQAIRAITIVNLEYARRGYR